MNTAMEHIHGIDVSWMTHGSSADSKGPKPTSRRRNTLQSQQVPFPPADSPSASPKPVSPIPIPGSAGHAASSPTPSSPSPPPAATGLRGRRPSWFTNISAKFSTSPNNNSSNSGGGGGGGGGGGSSPTQNANGSPKQQAEPSVPRANPVKNAVLQHASKHEGEGPYTPAPPRSSGQAGILHVLRRLSASSGSLGPASKGNHHGLVERRVLNVDKNRERCKLAELNEAKLRRVAFCVDVEIAPMPKYLDAEPPAKKPAVPAAADKTQKRRIIDKSEGEALKNAAAAQMLDAPDALASKASPPGANATATATAAVLSSAAGSAASSPSTSTSATPIRVASPAPPSSSAAAATANGAASNGDAVPSSSPPPQTAISNEPEAAAAAAAPDSAAGDVNKKKEKKKKSEEERKARKERKRRLAEANGIIPMEIYLDSDDSEKTDSLDSPAARPTTPRTQLTPTTNPVRIYRRCCQLRETPILKKITEQLSDPALFSSEQGVVTKLDLTGYWLQLADLVTLGDFLAVVPIRELVLENCGLNDEGLRVILAGLLAARRPEKKRLHLHHYHHYHTHAGTSSTHKGQTVPVTAAQPDGTVPQGGFVERVVLKNNKFGVEGWKHVCLFIYKCRSLKVLDLSNVVFPHVAHAPQQATPTQNAPQAAAQPAQPAQPAHAAQALQTPTGQQAPQQKCCVSELLSKSIGGRLGGATLELLNIGDTGLSSYQLSLIVDGLIQCGTKRLGLAHNDLDDAGVQHVARYLASGKCEGLDLGGNDLRDRLGVLAEAIETNDSLWALSLADCNLAPFSLCKLLPKLVHLSNFRFLDLSHNHDLFKSKPNATTLLRRYLPMMGSLKRLHLADVAMTSEQAIAIAEVLPEVKELAHLNILQNAELTRLAEARTEEAQEQACALYASFLAATRLSTSIVAVDMPVPTADSTEIVRAMAKHVLAYCLRNVDRVTLGNAAPAVGDGDGGGDGFEDAVTAAAATAAASAAAAAAAAAAARPTADSASDSASSKMSAATREEPEYPDVLQHLVGHDATVLDEEMDVETAPDDDYVIGGTGVAQALECCLKNHGPEESLPLDAPGELLPDGSGTLVPPDGGALPGPVRAKDMSKHLLQSARKIRLRLQPALQRARAMTINNPAYQRLLFLDNTLDGIIKRFEEEFPETRVSIDSGVSVSQPAAEPTSGPHASSLDAGAAEVEGEGEGEGEADAAVVLSDGEDETDILPSRVSRSNSIMSLSSKGLTEEEGQVLRAGHRFRSSWFKYYNVLSGVDEISSDPKHTRYLMELVGEINDPAINEALAAKGIVRLFKEDRDAILRVMREQDPEYFDRFIESQEKARANLKMEYGEGGQVGGSALMAVNSHEDSEGAEEAVVDD